MGSGRTDAGVHARGQVAHFDTHEKPDPIELIKSLNGILPPEIAIIALEEAPGGFHARFDAIKRTYRYHVAVLPRALDRATRLFVRPAPDFELMNKAASLLIGEHNFSSFCITQSATTNRVCVVEEATWLAETRDGDWSFVISANRFLHGMVRAITGTLIEIGQGKRDPDTISTILAKQDRREAGHSVKARGLVLHHVEYSEAAFSDA